MDIGKRLRGLRQARGFTQGEIEERCGLFRCYISRVENGHTVPTLDTLEKWAAALDVKLYEVFYQGKGKPQPPKTSEAEVLSPQEKKLFKLIARMDKPDRQLLLFLARKLARLGNKLD